MPKAKNLRILFDYAHNEIINLEDNEYHPFRNLLKSMECVIGFNHQSRITQDILQNIDLLVIGCPVESYFVSQEIGTIVDWVSSGGNLLVMSEVGVLQKTNLNDLMKQFGLYFENTTLRSKTNTETNSIVLITDIVDHAITKNVKKVMVGGCSTIRTVKAKGSMDVCLSGEDTWVEVYDEINSKWVKNSDVHVPVVSISIYGQGRIAAFGDVDMFSSNPLFGLTSLDNKQLIQNLIMWFHTPVRSGATIDWLLTQFSQMREDILDIGNKFDNLVTTARILEDRISQIEERQEIFQLELDKVVQTEEGNNPKEESTEIEKTPNSEPKYQENTENSVEK
ncbi:MAG: hypothetical protein EU530_01585 [Promethearchaeota archaeon]|nr:MAG: hypothetical protein EU530_01585 [Candidatus Lokiarchaeota archaeon]